MLNLFFPTKVAEKNAIVEESMRRLIPLVLSFSFFCQALLGNANTDMAFLSPQSIKLNDTLWPTNVAHASAGYFHNLNIVKPAAGGAMRFQVAKNEGGALDTGTMGIAQANSTTSGSLQSFTALEQNSNVWVAFSVSVCSHQACWDRYGNRISCEYLTGTVSTQNLSQSLTRKLTVNWSGNGTETDTASITGDGTQTDSAGAKYPTANWTEEVDDGAGQVIASISGTQSCLYP